MTEVERVELEREIVPIFPLPRIVFFPGTTLPLHVFENRYVRMIRGCLRSATPLLAVPQLAPGWQTQYDAHPPIHEVAGLGRIVEYEELESGAYNIVLAGTARVRLNEVVDESFPYRRAEVSVLRPSSSSRPVPPADLGALLSCAASIAAAVQGEHPEFDLGVNPGDPPGRVADLIADRLIADPDIRQQILETVDVRERIRLTMSPIGELLATLAGVGRPSRIPD